MILRLISTLFVVGAVWLAWPVLTFQSYPHVPLRADIGLGLLGVGWCILRAEERRTR